MPLTERSTILAFKAGRAFRRDGTNIVEPSADKGAIVIERGEDEEIHFMWKNRDTEETEEVRPFQFDVLPADYSLGPLPIPARCQLRECSASERPCVRSQVLFIGSKAFRKYSTPTRDLKFMFC
jgi:hypothetical protein